MVSFGDEAGKKKVWWTQPGWRSRCAALLIILYGLIAGPWVFAGEADRGPLQDYVDPPIIVPSQRGPEDIISIVMEYGGCFNFSNESSLEINGRSIVLVIGEVNLSTCIRSPRRAREFVIGRLDGGEYTLDVLIERGSPPGQVPPSPVPPEYSTLLSFLDFLLTRRSLVSDLRASKSNPGSVVVRIDA